ncbi:TPA: GPO family capsid scaffolding protein, partial [Escherichia coli]
MLTTTEQRTEESRQWFSRVMALISKTRTADGEQFSQLRDVVENIASDHADLIDRFSTLEQKHALDKTALDELSHEL